MVCWKSLLPKSTAPPPKPCQLLPPPSRDVLSRRGLTLAGSHAHDFRSVDVHQPRVHHHHGLALLVREAADAKSAPAAATAADLRILVVVSELGNAADDNGIHAQDLSDLRGRVRIGAIAVGEVLLAQYLVSWPWRSITE